ncbi:MAG TPA: hypothetical protein PLG77_15145 [Burkholderiaceae bacterium]|nr:hypothetical protein [Burkholderiaceae bacterium]
MKYSAAKRESKSFLLHCRNLEPAFYWRRLADGDGRSPGVPVHRREGPDFERG